MSGPRKPPADRPGEPPTPGPTDGRHARAARGKKAAIDAMIAILRSDQPILGSAHIARESGMSERTLFRYFGNQDGMFEAVAAELVPLALPYLTAPAPAGSLQTRVRSLAALRCEFARTFAVMGRTVDRFIHQFDAANTLKANREALARAQVETWLSPEFARLSQRAQTIVNEMMNFPFLEALNRDLGKGAADALADHVLMVIRADLRRS